MTAPRFRQHTDGRVAVQQHGRTAWCVVTPDGHSWWDTDRYVQTNDWAEVALVPAAAAQQSRLQEGVDWAGAWCELSGYLAAMDGPIAAADLRRYMRELRERYVHAPRRAAMRAELGKPGAGEVR